MEAHALDAWQDDDNKKDKISIASPKTLAERCAVEGTCSTKLALRIPAIIDGVDNSTERAYTAWPDRLYLIDIDGRIAYKSHPGPFGFKPDKMEAALRKILPALSAANPLTRNTGPAASVGR
jgi:type I thyroxine 5'-deiodinase